MSKKVGKLRFGNPFFQNNPTSEPAPLNLLKQHGLVLRICCSCDYNVPQLGKIRTDSRKGSQGHVVPLALFQGSDSQNILSLRVRAFRVVRTLGVNAVINNKGLSLGNPRGYALLGMRTDTDYLVSGTVHAFI